MNEITIGDKVYISAKRAAEITGYARDYVGQLCREGHVDAKMVGRSWYVYEPSIRAHRFGPETASAQEASDMQESAPDVKAPMAEESIEKPENGDTATMSDWQTPKYSPEAPEMLPELTPARLEELLPPAEETLTDMQAAWREWFDQKQKELETPEIESPEVIDARNEAYEAETEANEAEDDPIADEIDEVEEASIPLQRIEDTHEDDADEDIDAEEENIVPIHHIEPAPALYHAPISAPRMDISRDIEPVPQTAPISRYSGEYAAPQAVPGRIINERIVTKKGGRARAKKKVGRTSNAPIIAVLVGISLVSITIALIGTGYAARYLRTLPSENNPVIEFLVGTQKFNR